MIFVSPGLNFFIMTAFSRIKQLTNPFIESFLVCVFLSISQLVSVILTANFKHITSCDSTQIAIPRYINDWNLENGVKYSQLLEPRKHENFVLIC